MLFIKNGYFMDPKSGVEGIRDIVTDGSKIVKIGEHLEDSEYFRKLPRHFIQTIDAEGLIVAPGLVDVHVHFRDPGLLEKETIKTGAKAAAAGGFTSVVLMANTKPVVDTEETLRYVIDKGAKTGIHVYTCGSVTRGMEGKALVDMDKLLAAGAVGFTDDGKPILDAQIVKLAMEKCAAFNVPISFHEEDPKYIGQNGINHGKASAHFGIEGSDREAEITMVARDLELALETGACIDIQHISSAEAVELVRQAKKGIAPSGKMFPVPEDGNGIHAEATPHHFTLTEEAVIQYGTLAKMNPPLRTEKDREAIIAALADQTIDLIATDHAPHTSEEKAKPLTEAPSGIIGLETALALGVTELVNKKHLTMMQLITCMSYQPAKLYHLNAGYLEEGGPADLVLFDPHATQTFHKFVSKSQNSPFAGKTFKTKVEYTISDGNIAYIPFVDANWIEKED